MQQLLVTYFAFVPLILLIMFLPITANGIGTGQAALPLGVSRVGDTSWTRHLRCRSSSSRSEGKLPLAPFITFGERPRSDDILWERRDQNPLTACRLWCTHP